MSLGIDLDLLQESESLHQQGNVAKDLLSGTVAGIARVITGQPFDTVKVRLQSAPAGTYKGSTDLVRQIIRHEGASGFYKGSFLPIIGAGACMSVQFAVNEGVKRMFAQKENSQGLHSALNYKQLYIAGLAAGFASAFQAAPTEQVRIRMQAQAKKTFQGNLDLIVKIWQNGGLFRGIFHGLGPTILRDTHGNGMYFLGAEACVQYDMQINALDRSEIPPWRVCIYGSIAGVVMWLSVYPLDVLKSRMQTDSLGPSRRAFPTLYSCYKMTVNGGYGQLFAGFWPAILRAAPVNAVIFLTFELTRKALG